MQFIRDIYTAARLEGRPVLSLEFFPTKTEEGERALLEKTLPALLAIRPAYCSVTYGAGGGTRDKTLGIVDRIQRTHRLPAMMHLTCVGSTRTELGTVLDEARTRGIQNILALRGDPPPGTEFVKTEGGFEYSRELVTFIRERNSFAIGTAGFPEGHIAQKSGKLVDWKFLAEKVEAGADFVISQLFFDNADFYEFQDHLVGKLGVNVPIIPGIMPILSAGQTKRFVAMCGAKLPATFLRRIDELDGDDEAVTAYGIEYATEQCASLLEYGVPGLHFYTLNKARSTVEIARNLGLPTA
jgi:methylenetetrahydrofolate reductase (NADPH)